MKEHGNVQQLQEPFIGNSALYKGSLLGHDTCSFLPHVHLGRLASTRISIPSREGYKWLV